MATNILMPALSPTMTEGTLARWLKKEGDQVRSGDVLAEIETDKATMEVEAVDEGVLSRILVPDGTANVKVNEPIGVMDGDSFEAPAQKAAPKPEAATPIPAAMPIPRPLPASNLVIQHNERLFASPLARRMAKQAGIDLSKVHGTGPNGRIIRADIDGYRPMAEAPTPQAVAAPIPVAASVPVTIPVSIMTPAKALPITDPHTLVPNSTMRRVIAKRLTESHQSVPTFYVTMDIELDALLKLRSDLNARAPKEGGFKLSVNDVVIKACAVALRRVPALNASFTDEAIARYTDVDISVAVSIPDGLITPIIRKADQMGLVAISTAMKDLAARAKMGKLKPEEFQGGGFSISNLGMFGVKEFTAIINPPQAAILAVGAGEPRAVVKNGALAVATVMSCTLSVDHRVADGATGAQWMAAFKAVIEDPLSLML